MQRKGHIESVTKYFITVLPNHNISRKKYFLGVQDRFEEGGVRSSKTGGYAVAK